MDFSEEFSKVFLRRPPPNSLPPSIEFPMAGGIPVVDIDFDGTLAEYTGWKGHDHAGKPRPYAIWALRNFKYNGWETEIFTSRTVLDYVWEWVDKYAPGLIDRINESRQSLESNNDHQSPKPFCDLFIDDRNEYWFGRELDWLEIMIRLDRRGFLPRGLLPLPKRREGSYMLSVCRDSTFKGIVSDIQADLNGTPSEEILRQIQSCANEVLIPRDDKIDHARAAGRLLESVLRLMARDRLDPVGCMILAQQSRELDSVDTLPQMSEDDAG